MPKHKDIHFRLPRAVWGKWVQAMPYPGQRTDFLRQAVGVAIRFAPDRDQLKQVELTALKEVIDEQSDQSDRLGTKRTDLPDLLKQIKEGKGASSEDHRGDEEDSKEDKDQEPNQEEYQTD